MEAVRHVIDSSLLEDIIPLPRNFWNKKVEITVLLQEMQEAQEEKLDSLPQFTMEEIDAIVEKSRIKTLVGAIPDSGKTLEEYRAERLSEKYGCID
jgi:hypothetical protein